MNNTTTTTTRSSSMTSTNSNNSALSSSSDLHYDSSSELVVAESCTTLGSSPSPSLSSSVAPAAATSNSTTATMQRMTPRAATATVSLQQIQQSQQRQLQPPPANKMTQRGHSNNDLPSLHECLYGVTTTTTTTTENQQQPQKDNSHNTNTISSIDVEKEKEDNNKNNQHHHYHTYHHDIDISILRKLCSYGNGIISEQTEEQKNTSANTNTNTDVGSSTTNTPTCHENRGVAWRVLLNQLPTKNIYQTWPQTLLSQRQLYQELVSQYLNHAVDPIISTRRQRKGKVEVEVEVEVEKEWEKEKEVDQQQQHADEDEDESLIEWKEEWKEVVEELNSSLTVSSSSIIQSPPVVTTPPAANNNNSVNNDRRSMFWSDSLNRKSSMYIRVNEDIYHEFPTNSKYKELWKQSGITLNKGESAAAIGMNELRIPSELLIVETTTTTTDDTDETETTIVSDSESEQERTRTKNDKVFAQYLQDAKTLSEIRKDVVRTHPTNPFYHEATDNLGIRRHAALERILFLWAKLNGNLYVQGMNEIVGTLYYVLATETTKSQPMVVSSTSTSSMTKPHNFHSTDWADYAEADTYYLFHNLMLVGDIRDVYDVDLDHSRNPTGLHSRIQNIEQLLDLHDPQLYHHLKIQLKLDTSYYSIRWLTTLLCREFHLHDTIRLWDSMFASTNKENFVRYVCATMVMNIRDQLLKGDFGTCLKLLQNYRASGEGEKPLSTMNELLASSRSLWMYESQISIACSHTDGSTNHPLISLPQALQMIQPPTRKTTTATTTIGGGGNIVMAYGYPGGIYSTPPKFTDQLIESASVVSGQVFDVVDGIVLSAESSLVNSSSAAIVAPKKVSRMFGKAKQFWNNRNSTNNRASGTQSNDQNNEETNNVGTTVDDTEETMTTTTTSPTTTAGILDDGWDIIDSIINGNDGYLKHRRPLEDEEEDNCRTSMTGETAGNRAEDVTLVEKSSMTIPRPSSQLPIIAATTTPTTTMSMTDTTNHHTREGGSDSDIPRGSSGSSGGFVVGPSLHKAKNRLWNRLRSSSSSS